MSSPYRPIHGSTAESKPASSEIVMVRDLRKSFRDVVALNGVSLNIRSGEVFGILGPNGAGKTTTVECIAGAHTAESGEVRVLGIDPAKQRSVIRAKVGYQLQSTALPASIRVEEAITLFASFYARSVPSDELLDTVGLGDLRKRSFANLSGGQKQRLSIALALVGSPELIILDELTTGLDPQGRRDVWELVETIRDAGVTVILVSHYLDEVERLCDRIAVIASGRTRFLGTPAELVDTLASAQSSKSRSLEDAYLALLSAPPAA